MSRLKVVGTVPSTLRHTRPLKSVSWRTEKPPREPGFASAISLRLGP